MLAEVRGDGQDGHPDCAGGDLNNRPQTVNARQSLAKNKILKNILLRALHLIICRTESFLREGEMRVVSKGLLFAAVTMLAPAVAQAALVMDQNYDPSFNVSGGFASSTTSNFQRAETFTVGIAGTLAEVGIYTTSASTTFSGIDILSTSGGTPTLTVLASGNYVSTNNSGLAMFDVSLPVTVGEVLGLEPFVSSGGYWEMESLGNYAGGQDFFMNQGLFGDKFLSDGNSDGFVTYVNTGGSSSVPEPASFALLGGGLALLFGVGRAKRA